MFIDSTVIKKIKLLIHCLALKPFVFPSSSFLFIKSLSEKEHILGTHLRWRARGCLYLPPLPADQSSIRGRDISHPLSHLTHLGSQGSHGSLGLSQTASQWPHGGSGPVCGSRGPPEVVSVASPMHCGLGRNVSCGAFLVPGQVCGSVFFFFSNLEGVEY